MNEYEHGKTEITMSDLLYWFCYPFFILLIGIIALEQRYYPEQVDCITNDFKSLRSEVVTFKSNIQDSKIVADTTYTIERCIHVNPLTGTIDKFYGE